MMRLLRSIVRPRRLKISEEPEPIFLVGVPRSGTTLLRVLMDSHSRIACGPETPWLARHEVSVKSLYGFMRDDPLGYVQSYGVEGEELRRLVTGWVRGLFETYARKRGKLRWAEKTPDHVLEIDFLAELFPQAFFIHLVRDGRDVACSTAILSPERQAISEWHTKNLLLDDQLVVPNSLLNAAKRWKTWTEKIEDKLSGRRQLRVRYEDLLGDPVHELERLLGFVGEEFEPRMLEFSSLGHHLPGWEWGSRDVLRQPKLTNRSVERWKKQLSSESVGEMEELIGARLIYYGYRLASCQPSDL